MIKIEEKAPEFTNVSAYHNGEYHDISLSDYKGKWLALFFYPRDFTFVCPTEIKGFADLYEEFKKNKCEVLACSTDSKESHKAWFEKDLPMVKYPVLADTTQKVSASYDVLGSGGASQRGTFLIDPSGIVKWVNISADNVGRSIEETLRSLKALQTGGLCPADWQPGEKTIEKK